MTDEEKKAIEFVKSELQDEKIIRNDYQSLTGLYGNLEIEIILNLIEKQSKEIEELKEDRKKYAEEYIHNNPWLYKQLNENYILRVEADGLCSKKWEDKIKAKIEEVKDGTYDAKIVLQSLLEKE